MSALIEAKNLEIKFGKKKVLNNVTFTIDKGDLISLIGLNGAGKTTLLKAILGTIKTTGGSLDIKTTHIGYVPQYHDIDLSFPITVRELCSLYGSSQYEKYLKEIDILELADSRLNTLSGGQMQKVLIASALSKEPELLLLDEPTSGIDIKGEESFYKLINKIREKNNITIILVSHDMHLVFKHANKIICLAHNICCQGPPQEINENKDFMKIFGPYLKPYTHKHDHCQHDS